MNELLGAVVLSIAPPYIRDRTDDKLFERRSIKISKLLEVQASLAHPVLAKLGQQGSLLLSFSHDDVDNTTSHRSEIRMLDIPAVVQKVAFPVLLAAGTILGKYDKFKDAPEPVLETQAGSPHSTRAV